MRTLLCRALGTRMQSVQAKDSAIAQSLTMVLLRAREASLKAGREVSPRLVAVSKTKPVSDLREAYDAGQRCFGENYVQEIVDKSPELPSDVQWHFIGHLQSNKVKTLLEGVPSLACIETVDSQKLANKLDNTLEKLSRDNLKVFVQVNTSGEESKYGVEPGPECVSLCKHIEESCPHLTLSGLMTIGQPDYSSRPENFVNLRECRKEVCAALGKEEDLLELSMGMSGDFVQATEMGSTNIRVGSTIFGARDYSNKT